MNTTSLGESELTLSGVLQVSTGREATHVPLTEALQLSLQAVRLVAATHDQGKVVGVLDAAHLICGGGGELSIRSVGGNPVAPELKRGEMPDRLTDVYALGALMYRLLTGKKVDPKKVIVPPSHFNPAVDTGLDELVLRSLDEDPSERPYSAREVEQILLGIYEELGLEDSRTAATNLIVKAKKRPAMKAVSDAAPKRYTPPPPVQRRQYVEPDLTADLDLDDDDDEWQPQLDKNPLEKKWLIAGVALLALFLVAFFAWPSAKREAPRQADDDAPPISAKAAPTETAKPTVSPVQAKLVEPIKAAAPAPAAKAKKSPKVTTRRARR